MRNYQLSISTFLAFALRFGFVDHGHENRDQFSGFTMECIKGSITLSSPDP
jgi:hypothetical protein